MDHHSQGARIGGSANDSASDIRQPVFIVGAPRSGTTLLAALLSGHSRLDCGPETQFFNKLSTRQLQRSTVDRSWPNRAARDVASLTLAGQQVIDLFGISYPQLEAYLCTRRPGIPAMLEALTATHAHRAGKPRWVEKTPNHLLHLERIRRTYPAAPVIRIVRDPRDAAFSMRKLPWASYSALANAHLWADWHEASRSFFQRDRLSRTVRYEDLVRQPERELRLLCEFVCERFEQQMLDTTISGAAVATEKEPWKMAVRQGIDASRVAEWRKTLPSDLAQAVAITCHAGLEEFGYDDLCAPRGVVLTDRLDRLAVEQNEAQIIRAATASLAFRRTSSPLTAPCLTILCVSEPSRKSGIRNIARLALLVLLRRLTGRRTRYGGAFPGLWPVSRFLAILATVWEPGESEDQAAAAPRSVH